MGRDIRHLMRRFKRFLGVGAIGFVVDAGVFFTALTLLGVRPVVARLIASSIAIAATWRLNRRYTFADRQARHPLQEFLRYGAASLAAAAANLVGVALLSPFDAAYGHVPSYIAGTAAGLVVNFVLYERFVFRDHDEKL